MATTVTGYNAPQKLFSDIPESVAQVPGMVTPNITASMPQTVDWGELAQSYALQQKMKADRDNAWARASAANRANAVPSGWNQPDERASTASQSSGMGQQYGQQAGGSVLWAPRNLGQSQLGTWASGQQTRAMNENRPIPVVLQAHVGDPWSPGEQGGGVSQAEIGRHLFGPGLSTAMGGGNPAKYAQWLSGKTNSPVGRTRQAEEQDVFPEESLRSRTSRGPQYQYDLWGGR